MKKCIKCNKIKELNDFYKAKSYKDGRLGHCKSCEIKRKKLFYSLNSEKILLQNKKWSDSNKEKTTSICKKYYKVNKHKILTRNALYKDINKEEEKNRKKKWREANYYKCNTYAAKYRAIKLQQTPPWLTKTQLIEIEFIYRKSQILTELTGIKHHVDHIVPLQGKQVRGLHVPWNLQVLIATDNLSKGNRILNFL